MRKISLCISIIILMLLPFGNAQAFSFNNPIVDAADSGDAYAVKKLVDADYNPDSKGDFGTTALMRAAYHGRTEIVRFLLNSGAYVNETDIGGATALHLAATNGHQDVAEILIEYDAYINIADKEQWTPLMRATMAKKDNIVDLLIKKGANVALTNNLNQSVLMHAAMVGNKKILASILDSKGFLTLDEGQKQSAIALAEKRGNEKMGQMISATVNYLEKTPDFAPVTQESLASNKAQKPLPSVGYDEYSDYINRFENSFEKQSTNAEITDDFTPEEKDRSLETNSFAIQLGAFSSQDQTIAIWKNLQKKFPDILGGLELKILRSKGEKREIIYRLLAGYFSWQDSAEASCSSMRSRNVACFVVPIDDPYYESDDTNQRNSAPTSNIQPVPKPNLSRANNNANVPVRRVPQNPIQPPTPPAGAQAPWLGQKATPIPPKPQPTPQEDVEMEEIRKMLRQEFFQEQGLKAPEISKAQKLPSNIDPTKSVRPHTPIARAVKVPDSTYFDNNSPIDMSSGTWVKIGNFANRYEAEDYATRTFRYDESLNALRINIKDDTNRYGNISSIQMGPANAEQVATICKIAIAGGLKCAATNKKGQTQRDIPKPQKKSAFSPNSYWINLGTFTNSPEAEYYWMFLNEDNADILDNLNYNLKNSEHGSFGPDAVQLQVGPFGVESRASQLCNIIKYRNIACIVVQ